MKKILKTIVKKIILIQARLVYLINGPFVIGVTGSVGKTSTREAIYLLLHRVYGDEVMQSKKSYNGDIGLPLTLLQQDSGFSSFANWSKVILFSFIKIAISFLGKKLNMGSYPKYILAEYGIDYPGEMDKQIKVAKPDVAIITKIALVHTHKLKNIEKITEEKGKIVEKLFPESTAILNYDDQNVRKLSKKTWAKVLFFGRQQKEVHVGFSNLVETARGIEFMVHDNIHKEKMKLEVSVIGGYHVYVLLPAIAVGLILGVPFKTIVGTLRFYIPPKGRMRLLEGINKSIIIDGSYNASPTTMHAAIKTMSAFTKFYRILFLGDMRELGPVEKEEHEKLALLIIRNSDYVVLIGPLMGKYTKSALIKLGYPENRIFDALNPIKGGEHICTLIEQTNKKTVIMCKGSQNTIRLEKGIKIFLSTKENPNEVLVRQEKEWLKI